jgi:hypothetical protein
MESIKEIREVETAPTSAPVMVRAAIALMLVMLAACNDEENTDTSIPTPPGRSAFYTIEADQGRIESQTAVNTEAPSQMLKLVLEGSHPTVVEFSDRPLRQASHLTLSEFVRDWNARGFGKTAPTATLTARAAGDEAHVLTVTLHDPELDESGTELRFRAEPIGDPQGFPTYFVAADLFIDGLQPAGPGWASRAMSLWGQSGFMETGTDSPLTLHITGASPALYP